MLIPIGSLNLDFQAPECLFDETVWKYSRDFEEGRTVPPVEVYSDGQTYWLFDGFHRVAAAASLGIEAIGANITVGTYEDMQARWPNAANGSRPGPAGVGGRCVC